MKIEEYNVDNLSIKKLAQLIDLGEIRIMLLDTRGLPPLDEGRKNLLAVDKLDNIIWVADLPPGYLFASYWTIEIIDNELYALCGSFLCQIDIKTGKIISERFVK